MAPILFSDYQTLNEKLQELDPGIVFILVDSNTRKHCLPFFLETSRFNREVRILEIKPGEQYKTIDTCKELWMSLSSAGADRNSVMMNIGGGVITDIGGFVATTYQRGMPFIHLPTSLLAMADASVGGKNSVDLGQLKNQVGLFQDAVAVLIDPEFLKTLPTRHLRAGFAEILKISFVSDNAFWNELRKKNVNNITDWQPIIEHSIELKSAIVEQDQLDLGKRKLLNFGHTVGHAFESHALSKGVSLLHGEAVALGMIVESGLSVRYCGFPAEQADEISTYLKQDFSYEGLFQKSDINDIINLMRHDKKNRNGRINFTLLESTGKGCFNQYCSENDIESALNAFI